VTNPCRASASPAAATTLDRKLLWLTGASVALPAAPLSVTAGS
jgi:hypothetical protein